MLSRSTQYGLLTLDCRHEITEQACRQSRFGKSKSIEATVTFDVSYEATA